MHRWSVAGNTVVFLSSLTPSPKDHKDLLLQPPFPQLNSLSQNPTLTSTHWRHTRWAQQVNRWANWRPSPLPPSPKSNPQALSLTLKHNTGCSSFLPISPMDLIRKTGLSVSLPSHPCAFSQSPITAGTPVNPQATHARKSKIICLQICSLSVPPNPVLQFHPQLFSKKPWQHSLPTYSQLLEISQSFTYLPSPPTCSFFQTPTAAGTPAKLSVILSRAIRQIHTSSTATEIQPTPTAVSYPAL